MRPPPNKFLRTIIPLALLIGGAGMLWVVSTSTSNGMKRAAANTPQAPAVTPVAANTQPPTTTPEKPADKPVEVAKPADPPTSTPSAATTPAASTPPAPTTPAAAATAPKYTVRKQPMPVGGYQPLGSAVPHRDGGKYELELRFSDFGAGLDRLTLANHLEEVLKPEPHIVQTAQQVLGDPTQRFKLTAFSAKGIQLNGVSLGLQLDAADAQSTYWREVGPGQFEATIENEAKEPVLTIVRKFTLPENSYEFSLAQTLTNKSGQPLNIVFHDIGPIDQPQGIIRYGGDPRHIRFGFMDDPKDDPSRTVFSSDNSAGMINRTTALGKPNALGGYPTSTLWPNTQSTREQYQLVWAATTSRYFTVAAYNPPFTPPPATAEAAKVFSIATVDRVAVPIATPPNTNTNGPFAAIGLEFVSQPLTIAPGAAAELPREAYAGPTSKKFIETQPQATKLGLAEVVIYTFGGPCGFCTFQSITYLLRTFLTILHDHVLFDWALAIMVLVVCVRSCLHPVTRWSQVNMLRFSKNLQRLAPKQKIIQEKYKDEPLKMREEMSRLMREEGVGIGAGAMGCLPAFLQTPVWIALSATLYFAFELRHQAAFFGVFQKVSGGKWAFFADLAEPDHFIRFGSSFSIPLLSSLMGPIDGLNVMPLILGVVFFIQQKYLTPPSATPLTPEQEQQQKIMKVMTVVLFPVMMYNAPSGLALYFAMNSSLAIIESRLIRKRAEPMIEAEIARNAARVSARGIAQNGKKEARKPGLFERLQKMAEDRQKMMDEAKRVQAKKDKGKK